MTPHKTIISFHGWGSHHREMDRYCLPTVEIENFIYLTFDSFGMGRTKGNKNRIDQVIHAEEILEYFLSLPFVDKTNVYIVGMSLGAAKAAYVGYQNEMIKGLILLSGPYDLILTNSEMTPTERLIFKIFGYSFKATQEELVKYSAIHKFNPEGVKLMKHSELTPNHDRIFLLANEDDPAVSVNNTRNAIEKLNLTSENYRIFPRGKHTFQGNEYHVSVAILEFIRRMK